MNVISYLRMLFSVSSIAILFRFLLFCSIFNVGDSPQIDGDLWCAFIFESEAVKLIECYVCMGKAC